MASTFAPTVDPLASRRDAEHPVLWYYMGRPMGWLTPEAVAIREERYAENRKRLRWPASSAASAFIDHGRASR